MYLFERGIKGVSEENDHILQKPPNDTKGKI
jgi:hypothetical protein